MPRPFRNRARDTTTSVTSRVGGMRSMHADVCNSDLMASQDLGVSRILRRSGYAVQQAPAAPGASSFING